MNAKVAEHISGELLSSDIHLSWKERGGTQQQVVGLCVLREPDVRGTVRIF
jgi:hypothetical protein